MSSVVALHADGREDQAALLVDVAREGHVRGRLRVAAVGLVRLGRGGEDVPPSKKTGTRMTWSAGWVLPR